MKQLFNFSCPYLLLPMPQSLPATSHPAAWVRGQLQNEGSDSIKLTNLKYQVG